MNDFISRAVAEAESEIHKTAFMKADGDHYVLDKEKLLSFLTHTLQEHAKWIEEQVANAVKEQVPNRNEYGSDNAYQYALMRSRAHNADRAAILAAFKEII